ncbi:hypothetical protein KSP40_PGU008036 [Platanthera guangdongensis]|uniref:SUI1 domain-containing protein n=1 Tax=Platanthera guangdongensis TaxID=2320717 RepID=A0ABR2MKQ5_9ASPA
MFGVLLNVGCCFTDVSQFCAGPSSILHSLRPSSSSQSVGIPYRASSFLVYTADRPTDPSSFVSNSLRLLPLVENRIYCYPFAEANADNAGAGSKEYVHIRVQQRNGRKSLTTVQGLKKAFSKTKILKDLKKEFCCNGTVVEDPELGQVIQLQGDQRKNVSTFLIQAGIVKEQINIHGF